ncbi:hypothetical protein DFP72DRAFT_197331 [Ephemerocybe angulata]|uniref:Uncharacterized protein n=1 Tax=Ephemerocybe angulata TaxID=980116 RepID=A0A8H6H9W4_9AGAR|nr:hypothetical protein DFP72DRAFT_197331 [Tulosesus angulatus]
MNGVAELSRPARVIQQKIMAKKRKPQGRKKKTPDVKRPAKYHNWFTPLIWALLEKAVKRAGIKMSPTAIVKEAKKLDPEIFDGLRHSTVAGWIDRKGLKARWTDSVIQRIQKGNLPGHTNGGQKSILVRWTL